MFKIYLSHSLKLHKHINPSLRKLTTLAIMSKKGDTYNNEPFGQPKRRAKRTFLGALFVILLLAVTISLCVALVIAYLTPYVPPATFGSLTIVGIFAPILYMGVAVCMLLWLVTGRWKSAGIVALFLIPGLFRVSDFYNVDFIRKVESKPDKRTITILTHNIRGFRDDSNNNVIDGYVDYYAALEDVDVVCIQEYTRNIRGVERIDSLFDARFERGGMREVVEGGEVVLRTYSVYPIIASGDISGKGRGTSQWVDILVNKSDTVRIFNNHLHTMSISADDSEDIEQGRILQDGDRMLSIVNRIANNSSIRADYVDTLRMVIESTPHERIICGDFNDTPMSYVYGELVKNHKDAFVECGSGYGYTFRPMYNTLRIDYILHSEGMTSQGYAVDVDMTLSDHLPVRADIKLPTK